MTTPTFTAPIAPSPGTSAKPELKLLVADFGDGYTQTARQGMNHNRSVVSLVWDILDRAEASEITDFLHERGGDQPFYFVAPGDSTARLWTCQEWDVSFLAAGLVSVRAVLKQSFNTP